jgi:rhodanese-related sulfurtransferase
MNLQEIINDKNTSIVDVRETYEFAEGHAKGAVNIPLSVLQGRIAEFNAMAKPIVVYCRSGMRSAQAMGLLKAMGVQEVYNGGSLYEVEACQDKVLS